MGNEIQLSEDLNVITAEINSYKQVAGQAIFEIGRRLKHVREEIFKEKGHLSGRWAEWCKEIDMNITTAKRFIQIYEKLDDNRDMWHGLGMRVLYEIATLPQEEREKEHTLSSGETKTVDEMTVRELQEVKRKNKELERQLKEEQNKPTKVVEKEVIKEIDNTDHNSLHQLNKQVAKLEKRLELITDERNAYQSKVELLEEENSEHRQLRDQIESLTREKSHISRQIEAATNISGLVVEVDHLIKTKLSPVKYSKAIREMQDDEIVIENLTDIVQVVQSWCDEMKEYLPNERKIVNTIHNMEVIDYDG